MIVKDLITELHKWDDQTEVLIHTNRDIFHDYAVHHLETKAHESRQHREERFCEERFKDGFGVVLVGGMRV